MTEILPAADRLHTRFSPVLRGRSRENTMSFALETQTVLRVDDPASSAARNTQDQDISVSCAGCATPKESMQAGQSASLPSFSPITSFWAPVFRTPPALFPNTRQATVDQLLRGACPRSVDLL